MHEQPIKKEENKISSALRDPWPELPKEYVSVFHYKEGIDSLDEIARNGIRNFAEKTKEVDMTKEQRDGFAFDKKCDEIAQKLGVDIQRSKSVFFALPPTLDTANWSRFGDIALEIKVNARKAYVVDRLLHTLGAMAYSLDTEEGIRRLEEDSEFKKGTEKRKQLEDFLNMHNTEHQTWENYVEQYLTTRISLNDYLAMQPEDRRQRIKIPEIITSSPILPEYIRIAQKDSNFNSR